MRKKFYIMAVLASVLMAFQVAAETEVLHKVSFIPQWIPQAQFAGYYMALQKGLYRKHSLEVTLLRGGPDSPASELVANAQADFGSMFLATGIEKRDQGVKVINIAQIVQRSSMMLVAKKRRGITKPEDMQGKKVGLWGPEFQLQPRALFKRFNLSVHEIPQSTTVTLFLRDGVDVVSAMWYNEYHTILNSGLDPDELTTFFFFDYELNFPEDGIYCLEKTYLRDPALCCAFVDASLEGWQYAFDHPEETLDVVMRYVNDAKLPTNRVHQRWMLNRMKDIIVVNGETRPDPKLKADEYYRVGRQLEAAGLIQEIPPYDEFYLDCRGHDQK